MIEKINGFPKLETLIGSGVSAFLCFSALSFCCLATAFSLLTNRELIDYNTARSAKFTFQYFQLVNSTKKRGRFL